MITYQGHNEMLRTRAFIEGHVQLARTGTCPRS